MKFYDRENELKILKTNELQSRGNATFMVLNGRRRIGKTSLLLKAMEGLEYAYMFISNDNEAMLCKKFCNILQQQLNIDIYGTPTQLGEIFDIVMKESTKRHFTIIFDEFQTLYKINPAIFGEIQDLWDRYHTKSKINLIVSGSIQSLMRQIFGAKGEPLYGRPTSRMTLRPFGVKTIKEIIADHCPNYDNESLLCLYMITGGVPKYVELLMDAGCTTKDKMLEYVCRPDSYFLTEGRDIMNQEFNNDSATYYSILQLVASGITRRSEIDSVLQKDMGSYLQNLEQNFGMLTRKRPLFARPNGKNTSYEVSDIFMRFWFKFICPYQSLIEQQQMKLLLENIKLGYEQFSGRTLEQYFQTKYMETGNFTQIGNWWDRKGGNEIDMIALNEINRTGIVAEIKRNPKKINPADLERKIANLPKPDFAKYTLKTEMLSIKDM